MKGKEGPKWSITAGNKMQVYGKVLYYGLVDTLLVTHMEWLADVIPSWECQRTDVCLELHEQKYVKKAFSSYFVG